MLTLENSALRYMIDEQGLCRSAFNKITNHEMVLCPDFIWRLIYAEGERTEIPVYARDHKAEAEQKEDCILLRYPTLQGDGRTLNVSLEICLKIEGEQLQMTARIENHDEAARVMEIYLCPIAGVQSLSGCPEKDNVTWPASLGRIIPNPAFSDLSVFSGFRKYERHDQYHTDLCSTYPAHLAMKWFDWFNGDSGLYIASHDTDMHTLSLDCEREVKTNTLRLGVIRYPMLEPGESEALPPVVAMLHAGDWHAGSRAYRSFMLASGLYRIPERPDWARDFNGWLRVILKQHHLECNWTYKDIPRLYDEVEDAGMKTIFLLGWEKGGFARMWPDYFPDEGSLGTEAELKQGIDYVHSKGGKVIMFLSYSLLDHESDYYRFEQGEECTVKTIWKTEVPFAETYCGEGTYRKLGNPPMPMYVSCPGSDRWQKKMLKSADDCLDLGADGVLYDLGGLAPYFCYDKRHNHRKPSHAVEQKAARFAELREEVRRYGEDKIILMEHSVDIFNQSMDIVQPSRILANGTNDPQVLYRYTFPELVMTNREHGQDEVNYRHLINHTAALGLRFDMTIWRCCGSLSDIPDYTAYLKEINAFRSRYGEYLLRGKFRHHDGMKSDNANVVTYLYEADDGSRAVLCWNDQAQTQTVNVTFDSGRTAERTLEPETLAIIVEKEL